MKKPIWLPLAGYENLYLISTEGQVKSTARDITSTKGVRYFLKERNMSVTIDRRSGYPVVKLTKGPKYGSQYLHRLMAITFIPNPGNKPIVNHINGNKLDFRLENLEWVTRSENHLHALKTGLCKKPSENRTKVFNICTNQEFPSMHDAARYYQYNYETIKKMLKNKVINDTCLRLVRIEAAA